MTQPQYNRGSTAGQWMTESETTAVDTWQNIISATATNHQPDYERRIAVLERENADLKRRLRIVEMALDNVGAPSLVRPAIPHEHAD